MKATSVLSFKVLTNSYYVITYRYLIIVGTALRANLVMIFVDILHTSTQTALFWTKLGRQNPISLKSFPVYAYFLVIS